MNTYCVKERKKTTCIPGSDELVKAKGNGRIIVRCICANCGIVKHSFMKTNKRAGLLDIHAAKGKLPKPKGGFTWIGAKKLESTSWDTELANELHKPVKKSFHDAE